MKEKKDCKIVQDILPNYVESLTNNETNIYIEKHLENCKDCREIFENMKKKIETNTSEKNTEEVNYMKKFKRKMKILKTIILSIILIVIIAFLASTIRKMIIISNLSHRAAKYINADNFKCTFYVYSNDYMQRIETYVLENKMKNVSMSIGKDGISTISSFGDKVETKKYYDSNHLVYNTRDYFEKDNKKIVIEDSNYAFNGPSNFFYTKNLWELLKCSIRVSIKETIFRGKKCYYIDNLKINKNDTLQRNLYVDKETGLSLYSNDSEEYIIENIYEFDIVTEDDLKEPDSTEYKRMKYKEYFEIFEKNN